MIFPVMTSFIDTHCHLDKLALSLPEALTQAKAAQVNKLLTISVDSESISFVAKTAANHEEVYGALGIHPHDAGQYNDTIAEQIRGLANRTEIVAVGETGLDYHYMYAEKEVQQAALPPNCSLLKNCNFRSSFIVVKQKMTRWSFCTSTLPVEVEWLIVSPVLPRWLISW